MPTVIDANVLIALFRANTSDSDKTRVEGMVSEARSKRKRLLIPSPALSEFAAKAKQDELSFLLTQPVFHIVPFDTKAALGCGELVKEWALGVGDVKKDRHKAKFDLQILAIAQACNAKTLVTNDVNLRNKANRHGLNAVDIKDLPIPDSARQRQIDFDKSDAG